MLELKRWNTPTIYNGWEQVTAGDAAADAFNIEESRDFMPHMGVMVGRAITVRIEPSNRAHRESGIEAGRAYREYVASIAAPKVVIVQDLDKPAVIGSFWGEVNANIHRSLGCVGTITDGAVRDIDEMRNAGFKALAQRLCVGHAYAHPVDWGGEVEVFGRRVKPGQLIHADQHGFMAIEEEDEDGLLEAARFMDTNECETFLPLARSSPGKSTEQLLADYNEAALQFGGKVRAKFSGEGEFG